MLLSLKKNTDYEGGFTIPEFMSSSFLGLMILGLALSATISGKRLLKNDLERTKLNQTIRSATELVGLQIRITGENLTTLFPAVELIDGASGSSDQLILRRNLLEESLTLCDSISAGSTIDQIIFADGVGQVTASITSPACVYADPGQAQNYLAWQTTRSASQGGEIQAYIYDSSTGNGEFFTYINEIDSGSSYRLVRSSGSWAYDYSPLTSSVYILEEYRYRLVDNHLQIVENRNWDNTLNIVAQLTDFQATVFMQDGTSVSSLSATDSYKWTDIEEIEIATEAREQSMGDWITRKTSSRYYPRNVLSN